MQFWQHISSKKECFYSQIWIKNLCEFFKYVFLIFAIYTCIMQQEWFHQNYEPKQFCHVTLRCLRVFSQSYGCPYLKVPTVDPWKQNQSLIYVLIWTWLLCEAFLTWTVARMEYISKIEPGEPLQSFYFGRLELWVFL
jgi:hypothetical protein